MHDTHTTRAIAPHSVALIPDTLPKAQQVAHLTSSGGETYRIERVTPAHAPDRLWLIILGFLVALFGVSVVALLLAIALKPQPTEIRVNPYCVIGCNADSSQIRR
jgi:hypothetical protein